MQNISSFKKGEEFEEYIQHVLFPESDYVLVHRTNNYDQNKDRFAENTLKPDFKFRCKQSQQEFYVEAKFRSHFNQHDKLEVMSLAQRERFLRIQETENIPVFIAVGYKGVASDPQHISFFPLNELIYLDLYPTFLRKFNVEKTSIDYKDLKFQSTTQNHTSTESTTIQIEPIPRKNSPRSLIFISAIFVSILFGWLIIDTLYFNYDDQIQQKTREYYKLVELKNVESLEQYISPKVTKWYNESNLTIDEVKEKTYAHLKAFPKSQTHIRWDTFQVEKVNDDYLATYNIVHTIKTKGKYYNKVYNLTIKALWSKNYKIKSLYEVR